MFADLNHLSHHAAWRRQLEMLLESAGSGIYGIDLRGRCIFINGPGAALLGYTPDEVVGRNMHYLIHHSHADAQLMPVHDCRIFKAFREGRGEQADDEVLWRRDGSSFPAEYASYPIRDNDQVIGAVVTFADISERKRIERQLQASHALLERRVDERTVELQRAQESLRRLAAHLSMLREEERARIARDIHDELGASFTALQFDLNWLVRRLPDEPALQQHLSRMIEVTTSAVGATRRILNDLRPVTLDHLGLWAALESLLQDVQARGSLACRYACTPQAERMRLGRAAEIEIYRIVQELLTNVQRHARASQVCMEIAIRDGALELVVRDDGVGLPAQPPPTQSYGILGMRERARAIGAALVLDSAPGDGTCATLRIEGLSLAAPTP
ncbi:two-component system sensor kinase [Bordetella ansorpii]|uniref:Two-component system sensor kinase n=1 Tax=Bordetella ansorpii TaxID=288768 RepID=A0A157S5I1_9BORD|nr:PAS domain-containing sensor histidine kinase [Bordetella ansorpii]SAI65523.1 two-component system sensor kinase [Bordetella ansorpii]